MNWHQIWEIASAPDNVPIVALLFLVHFYVCGLTSPGVGE